MTATLNEIQKQILNLNDAYILGESLKNITLPTSVTISSYIHDNRILLHVKEYSDVSKLLKILRRFTNEKFRLSNWYADEMIFEWSYTNIRVWFKCSPKLIPEELMPSKTCKVVETMSKPMKDFNIVCEVKT